VRKVVRDVTSCNTKDENEDDVIDRREELRDVGSDEGGVLPVFPAIAYCVRELYSFIFRRVKSGTSKLARVD
jgi:hypothetical protein